MKRNPHAQTLSHSYTTKEAYTTSNLYPMEAYCSRQKSESLVWHTREIKSSKRLQFFMLGVSPWPIGLEEPGVVGGRYPKRSMLLIGWKLLFVWWCFSFAEAFSGTADSRHSKDLAPSECESSTRTRRRSMTRVALRATSVVGTAMDDDEKGTRGIACS